MLTTIPGALIHGLFLTPDDRARLFVLIQNLFKIIFREGIQLLDTNHDGILICSLRCLSNKS